MRRRAEGFDLRRGRVVTNPMKGEAQIKWKRSKDDHCESKCGRFVIVPLYCGATRPQFYAVRDRHINKLFGGYAETQTEAKEEVEERLKRSHETGER